DSLVTHLGEGCGWPLVPAFHEEGSPACASSGSDSYVSAEVIGSQRVVVATTCPRLGAGALSAQPRVLLRTYMLPVNPRIMEESYALPMPDGPAGVALDGLAISGAPLGPTEVSDCGLSVTHDGAAYYATAPGLGRSGGLCNTVSAWAQPAEDFLVLLHLSSNESHAPLLGFMMDGVPLFGALGTGSNASTDSCGGHSTDLPFYHYHASGDPDARGGRVLGCLRGIAHGGQGFASPPAPVALSNFPVVETLDWLLPAWQYGDRTVLLSHARAAKRFPATSVNENGTLASFLLTDPAGGLT
ncbi:unnamed protein product, partial [Polarella glacialis]